MRTETPPTIYLKDYQPAPYLIDHVSLDFRLDAEETRVFARFDMRANPDFAEHGPDSDTPSLVLDGENINLVSITLTGEPVAPADYQVTSDKLILKSPPAEPFTLELETVCNPTSNTALSGLYRSGSNFCTQAYGDEWS